MQDRKMQDWKLTDKNYRGWKMTDTVLKDSLVAARARGPCTFELIQLRVIDTKFQVTNHKKTLYIPNCHAENLFR